MTESPAGSGASGSAEAGVPSPGTLPGTFADPGYVAAVVDLLGVIAYGELSAFQRLSEDAKMAPTLRDKAELARMAATQVARFDALSARLTDLGVDAFAVVAEFSAPFEAFHQRTRPADWLEGLVKAYVGDGLAADFYREVAAFVDADTRDLILETLADAGQAAFVVDRVRGAIAADPRVGGRLALWGRRLMGEALSQAQQVATERDGLTALLAGGTDRPALDLAALSRMFTRLTENHSRRMDALGLSS